MQLILPCLKAIPSVGLTIAVLPVTCEYFCSFMYSVVLKLDGKALTFQHGSQTEVSLNYRCTSIR